MIIGEIESDESYYDLHSKLLDFIKVHFRSVESGLQGDAYIWITSEGQKVSLDTFSSMKFQIKTNVPNGSLVELVIKTLKNQYTVQLYPEPICESHEEHQSL